MRNDLFTDHYGFVGDYIAEALREMRRHDFTEIIDRHFSLGSHLNARDRKAARKTVFGLMKILHPHGDVTRDELGELLDLALEGRRRVKEQLKKRVYRSAITLLLSLALWRIRIVPVAVRAGDLPVLVMDLELRSLVAADLAGRVDGVLLLVEVTAGSLGTTALDVPTALRIGHDMMGFGLGHPLYLLC